jgi:hypothetical protein
MGVLGFIVALLLLAGTVEPTQGWLIALTVVTGLAAVRIRLDGGLSVWPAFDVRLGAFIFAVLLLAGVIEPTKDWLIGLSIVTGVAAFMPRTLALDRGGWRGWMARRHHWDDEAFWMRGQAYRRGGWR